MVMLVLQTALLVFAAFLAGYAAFYWLAGRVRLARPRFPAVVRETRPRTSAPVPAPAPIAERPAEPAPPKPPGYQWAAWWEGGKIVLGRSIPSESVRMELLSLVRRIHKGVRIEDRMKVLEDEPEGWWIAASSAVRALSDLSQGRVSLDDLAMTIEGRAATSEGYERLKLTGAELEGAAFTVHSPYLEPPSAQRPPLPAPLRSAPRRPAIESLAEPSFAPATDGETASPREDAGGSPAGTPDTSEETSGVAAVSYAEIAARLAAMPKEASPELRADEIGSRPQALSAPRGGVADDLKEVKGIGPKNERLLNGLGVFHFDQIAGWTPDVVRWVEAYLAFPGRVDREGWIAQCAALAGGGKEATAIADEEPSV